MAIWEVFRLCGGNLLLHVVDLPFAFRCLNEAHH